jgi:phosphohistidine phosphatase
MKLYFIRHGRANQIATTDSARPLLPEGEIQAANMGKVLKKSDIKPIKIFCSPRLRALQTAQIIGRAFAIEPRVTDACNFHFNVNYAFELVHGMDENVEVLFVGHNPSMSEIVNDLTGANVELSTGAVACVSRVYPPSTSGAILKWLIVPDLANAILEAK